MPNLSGYNSQARKTKDEAISELRNLGFDVDNNLTIEEEYSDTVEVGYVISQEPEYQGDNFKINVTEPIKLVISKGQKTIVLPKKMVGEKLEDVTNELNTLEVKYEVTEVNDEKIKAGIIMTVEPKEGTEMSASEKVKITVSKGSALKDVAVPSVINKSQAQATAELAALGLVVSVYTEENSSLSDGVIIRQSITAGTTVKEGTSINIVLNKQPTRSTVTVNVNLKSLTGYNVPSPVVRNITNTTVDENGNTITTTTQVTEEVEIEKALVEIDVGDDVILKEEHQKTETAISKSWTTSGVKNVKVKIDGVSQFEQTVDFSQGNQIFNVQ